MGLLTANDNEAVRSNLRRRDIYEDDYINYASTKWEKFNEFRKSGEFCDVVIECDDGILHAHKCVLSAATPYFLALFTSLLSSTEGKQTVRFSDYSSKNVNSILEYVYNYYGYEMEESTEVEELLKLAEFLHLDTLNSEL